MRSTTWAHQHSALHSVAKPIEYSLWVHYRMNQQRLYTDEFFHKNKRKVFAVRSITWAHQYSALHFLTDPFLYKNQIKKRHVE